MFFSSAWGQVRNNSNAVLRPSPLNPDEMDWSPLFPGFTAEGKPAEMEEEASGLGEMRIDEGPKKLIKDVEVADIGCGFGGLLVALAPLMPETLLLGKE